MSRILKASNMNFQKDNSIRIDTSNFVPYSLAQQAMQNTLKDDEEFDDSGFVLKPLIPSDHADESQLEMQKASLSPQEYAESIVARAKEEAARIIQEAREDADVILDRMEEEAIAHINELKHAGHEEGYTEGYELGVSDTEVIKQDARKLYSNALREREEILNSLEPDIIELVLGILDKILSDMVAIEPGVISILIKKGLSDTKMSGDVTIRISETDYEDTLANKDSFYPYVDAGAKIDIVKDFSLKEADCVIETPFGAIDCSLEQQYMSLRKNLYYISENR